MLHFFNDPLLIYNPGSHDDYGRETYGTGEAVSGRFLEKHKLIYNAKGETSQSDAMVIVPGDCTVEVGSKIVFESVPYRVIQVIVGKDMSGNKRLKKIYLMRWGNG